MSKINVLVVDDSAFMRKVVSDILEKDSNLNVIGTARNGQIALEKIEILKPDVVTLDVEMPIMDGIETLEQIMFKFSLPVIMLSSHTKAGADATVTALEKGAIDFITKPSNSNMVKVKEELIYKIKMAAKVEIKKNLPIAKSNTNSINISNSTPNRTRFDKKQIQHIIVIGTSTGGPKALQAVIPFFSKNIPAPILIVQHMPPGFTKSLANRLNSLSKIEVKEAEQGEIIKPGVAYIAPGDYHLCVKNNSNNCLTVNLTKEQPVNGHRPAVDVMMQSVCQEFYGIITGVIMTGMGSDGTAGMNLIKKLNGNTIAESESTCVVFGMPRSAIRANCVDEVVPLYDIAERIIKFLQ